ARRLRMPDPDPDQQPLWKLVCERRVLGGELRRLVGPNIDDAGRDDEVLGRLQQWAHARKPRRTAQPEHSVAKLLDEPRSFAGVLLADSGIRRPDTDRPQIHRHTVRLSAMDESRRL